MDDPAAYRILLVEDNPGDVELMRQSLREETTGRFGLVHVERLADALEQLGSGCFDLVVLDLSLPDSVGLESFEKLKEAAHDVPVVVLTGLEDDELGATLVQMGAQDYVVKWQLAGHVLVRCLRNAIERQVFERELMRTRELALQAVRSKSEFLAAMSHEIRTPLNSILGMADLLSDTALTAEQDRYVSVFRTAGEALLDLINGILDFSKVEAGRLELDEIAFDLGALMESTMEILAYPAHKKRLTLAFEIAPDVPQRLVGDPARLRQVLVNLVGNANKFTERGEVVVRVARDPRSEDPGALLFTVQDTGIGIPQEKIEAIFERFSQADGSITRRYGGTGLGLSLCVGLVQLMGGRIWAESQPDRGSTFSFTARFDVRSDPAGESRRLATSSRGGRVLIADDSATERRILRNLLSERGLSVVEVESGRNASDELRRAEREGRRFDLVLVDCRMGKDGGFPLMESVAEIPGLAARTVMMLTADHRTGDVTRCERMGLGGWLVKPLKPSQLSDVLDSVLEGGRRKCLVEARPVGDQAPRPVVRRRILVVDDSEDNLALVQAYLKRTPHQVHTAENGRVAVEKFKTEPFDLILMDVQMPVMDGISAVKAIRSIEASTGGRTPVVALTAYAFKEERQRSLDAGCDAHLTKPIRKADLLKAVETYAHSSPIRVDLDDEVRDLVGGFLENRHRDVEKLRSAIESGDFETVRVLGHNMKGTGRSYGFDGLSDLGAGIERAGTEAEAAAAREHLAALVDYLQRVQISQ